jgi:hypothetical protein
MLEEENRDLRIALIELLLEVRGHFAGASASAYLISSR